MATVKITLVPEAEINFSRSEVELLMKRSRLHYDAHCRSVGTVGGFLYGMSHELTNWEASDVTRRLEFREIDTLAKLTEPLTGLDTEGVALYRPFLETLRELNEAYVKANDWRRDR